MDEIKAIKFLHRDRCFAMEMRKALNLKLGSYLRLQLGWRKDLPEKERKRIAAEAAALMAADEPDRFESMITPSRMASEIFEDRERIIEKQMAKLAKQLPVWEAFGKEVRGFGEVSLAVIVAEAGDLSEYESESKLWKRMGLAPGQNRVAPGLSREDRAEAWITRGYSPRRRSRMWNIGDALIKGNRDGKYRTAYLARKAYELAREPEMTPMYAHRRAQRYMEKRLLRDLWRAWRRTNASIIAQERKDDRKPALHDEPTVQGGAYL